MKATVFVRSAIALAMISVTGCSTWDSMSKTGQATTVGATSGAVGGAVVAGPVGAVAGAAIGGVAAHEMAKSDSTKPTTARSDSSSTYANDTAGRPANSTDSGGTYSSNSANSGTMGATGGSNGGAASSDSNSTKTTATSGQVPSIASESAAQRSMSHEADIRAVQQALNDHGYDAGNVDGVWGPKTAAAVRKFQTDRGLQATGRLDAETRTALGVSNSAVSSLPSQVSSAAQ